MTQRSITLAATLGALTLFTGLATAQTSPPPSPEPQQKSLMKMPRTEEMVRLAPEGGRFRVYMPGKPDAQVIELKSDFGPAKMNLYRSVVEQEEACYIAAYMDISDKEARATTEEQQFEGACEGLAKSTNGKIVVKKKTMVAGFPARDLTLETEAGIVTTRIILVDQRIYQMAVLQSKKQRNDEAVQEFFDSFRLTR